MKKQITFFLLMTFQFLSYLNAAVVTSVTDTYELTLKDVVAPSECTINEDGLSTWPSKTNLKWTVNINKTGRYLVKASICSDWDGSWLNISMGDASFSSNSCVTHSWGPMIENCYVGILNVTKTGEQEFIANNENGTFNVRKFILEPVDKIIQLKAEDAVASAEGVNIHSEEGFIDYWDNSETYLTYKVTVPVTGFYKLCGTFATNSDMKACLLLDSNGNEAKYEIQGRKSWSFFFYDSEKELFLSKGETEINVHRSSEEGFGPINLSTFYLTLTNANGLRDVVENSTQIKTEENCISIKGASLPIKIYNLAGNLVAKSTAKEARLTLPRGLYLVTIGLNSYKVVIK